MAGEPNVNRASVETFLAEVAATLALTSTPSQPNQLLHPQLTAHGSNNPYSSFLKGYVLIVYKDLLNSSNSTTCYQIDIHLLSLHLYASRIFIYISVIHDGIHDQIHYLPENILHPI